MSEQMEVLKAWMLGREEVTYGDKTILLGRNSTTKASKLLLLLLHCGGIWNVMDSPYISCYALS